jgi:hypothetical protein
MQINVRYQELEQLHEIIIIEVTDDSGNDYHTSFLLPTHYEGEIIADLFNVSLKQLMHYIKDKK